MTHSGPWRSGAAVVAALVAAGAVAGCQPRKDEPGPPVEAAPEERPVDRSHIYRLHGKVLDAATRRPLSQARLSLRVMIPGPVGARYARVYGVTEADGSYRLEVPVAVEVMRRAKAIDLTVSKPGYRTRTVSLPPPTGPVQAAPNVLLTAESAAPPAPAEPPEAAEGEPPEETGGPLPWK